MSSQANYTKIEKEFCNKLKCNFCDFETDCLCDDKIIETDMKYHLEALHQKPLIGDTIPKFPKALEKIWK